MAFDTRLKSAFPEPQKLTVQIAFALLSFSSPLLLCNIGWAQSVTREKVLMQSQQKQNKILVKFKPSLDNINNALRKYTSQDATKDDKDKAIVVFQRNLKCPEKQVRISAVAALMAIGTGAENALNDLQYLLQTERDRDVLISVIQAIQSIKAKPAISKLIKIFKDEHQDLQVRSQAVEALKTSGADEQESKEIIPLLLKSLKDQSVDTISMRISATDALSNILLRNYNPQKYPDAVAILTGSLKDPAWRVRRYATDTLGNIGVYAKSSIHQIITVYEKDPNYTPRQSAIVALGNISKSNFNDKGNVNDKKLFKETAEDILPVLNKALKDDNSTVRSSSIDTLRFIAAAFERAAKNNELETEVLKKAIPQFEEALKSTEKLQQNEKENEDKSNIQNIESSLQELQRRQVINQILKNPSVWGIGIYLVSLFGIFWLRPLWLLKIDKALKSVGSFKLPVIDKEISLSWLLLMLKYHPRVLDAWVKAHLKSVQEAFEQKDTVSQRNVYIPIPVKHNDRIIAQLIGKDLRSTFNKKRACLLIPGEGGVGKTSLACQIAKWGMSNDEVERLCKHRMLPVLIEDELEIAEELEIRKETEIQPGSMRKSPSTRALIKAIQGQLQNLTDEVDTISEKLLERLLRERRILVIVDHLSEMSETTRKAIRPDSPDFYVNALIVTSRSEEKLGQVTKTTLKPVLIQGNRLSSFMEAYLNQANKRDLFTDSEFFKACTGLSQMVGERPITALLAKLYANQLIAGKIEESQQSPLLNSDNIPDLMLWYLNELNRSVTESYKLDNRIVQQDAKVIAWECLKRTFRPTTAKRDTILAALNKNDPENRLKYFEERLHLIQTIGAAQDKIRFTLDPLAEYLAAMHVLELCQKDQSFWKELWHQLTTVSEEAITGFLHALLDCFQVLGKEASLPQSIVEELSKIVDHTTSQKTFIQT